jgi:hypothetical protein
LDGDETEPVGDGYRQEAGRDRNSVRSTGLFLVAVAARS